MGKLEKVLTDQAKEERIQNTANIIYTILILISIAFVIRGLALLLSDDVFVYQCSSSKEMGSTIKLTPIKHLERKEVSNEIYAFARNYILCLFPRNIGNAKSCYEYIYRHSNDLKISRKYKSFFDDFDKVKIRFERGMIDEFSPKSSQEYRIEKSRSSNQWVFEIDGYLNKRKSLLEEDRGIVTIRLTISFSDADKNRSYTGFYVDKVEILHLKNIITGEFDNVLED